MKDKRFGVKHCNCKHDQPSYNLIATMTLYLYLLL